MVESISSSNGAVPTTAEVVNLFLLVEVAGVVVQSVCQDLLVNDSGRIQDGAAVAEIKVT